MASSTTVQDGKPPLHAKGRACSRLTDLQIEQLRIRQAAQKDKKLQFTALWHHVYNIACLRDAYLSIKRHAAPGLDDQTWQQYGENLEANIQDLSGRLKRGAYQAKPAKRVYVPKADGNVRPIGILVLEDKIVQRATTGVLNNVYEADFKGFSYGFRPGRSQHNALDALYVGIETQKVNWVLDGDIRGFFDAIDHVILLKFVEHRISDQRVINHIKKWLNAGVLEDGEVTRKEEGAIQGGSISPLLSNIFLHYVFDLWANQWRHQAGRNKVIVVRFADDFVVGFESRLDALQFQEDLKERLSRFKLELHPEKTRLIEFGRNAAVNRKQRGEGKPETFDFLGFTHICGKSRKGRFALLRKTMRKKMQRKLMELKKELRKRMHAPISEVGKWLKSVLAGHYRYYGVPSNSHSMSLFRYQLLCYWKWIICRRSQRQRTTWERMKLIAARWLPLPHIYHPYPGERLRVTT
jgi:RNA-directed DNA polymerase